MKFEYLQGADGGQSSKRLFSFLLVLLFIAYFIVNLCTGKILDPQLANNLFYLLVIMYCGVAAEGWKDVLTKKPDGKDAK